MTGLEVQGVATSQLVVSLRIYSADAARAGALFGIHEGRRFARVLRRRWWHRRWLELDQELVDAMVSRQHVEAELLRRYR